MIEDMTTISGRSTTERDLAGEEALVTQHLPLVQYAVNELMMRVPRHVTRDDLVSAGMEGLCQAARGYDPSRGVPFHRYASTRIKGALIDEMRRGDWASRSVRVRARTVKVATETATARLGRTPTTAEIADAADMAPAAVQSVHEDLVRAAIMKFGGLQSGEPELLSDGRGPDSELLERERSAYLLDAVNALPERLRHVVVGYFFKERPMQQLADELGVTESQISHIRS
jgi:RNA polymerase sigma factor FliA